MQTYVLKRLFALIPTLFFASLLFALAERPYGMNEISPLNRMKAPSLAFPFGTDNLGGDLLASELSGLS